MLKNKYKNKIEIIKNYKRDIPKIECHPGKINQAMLNVLNNAIDAIPEKGSIEIGTKTIKNCIFVNIRDTGIGIPNEIKEHIFEPFYTTKEVGKGVGLGLSIAYGIIKDHNGELKFETKEGKGTKFIIKLPINQLITERQIN